MDDESSSQSEDVSEDVASSESYSGNENTSYAESSVDYSGDENVSYASEEGPAPAEQAAVDASLNDQFGTAGFDPYGDDVAGIHAQQGIAAEVDYGATAWDTPHSLGMFEDGSLDMGRGYEGPGGGLFGSRDDRPAGYAADLVDNLAAARAEEGRARDDWSLEYAPTFYEDRPSYQPANIAGGPLGDFGAQHQVHEQYAGLNQALQDLHDASVGQVAGVEPSFYAGLTAGGGGLGHLGSNADYPEVNAIDFAVGPSVWATAHSGSYGPAPTMAHEIAHNAHREHGPEHDDLTQGLLQTMDPALVERVEQEWEQLAARGYFDRSRSRDRTGR